MTLKLQKPKVGLLFIGCQRFRKLGEGCSSGNYETRRGKFVESLIGQLEELAECPFPGIVYDRADADRAMQFFREEKVDCVLCSFLSWSEDATWIYFLREMYDLPLAYYLPVLDRMPYQNTRDENAFVEFLAQGGLVGSLVGSGSVVRFNRKIEVITDDFESARPRLDAFFCASRTRSQLRNAHFGLLANYNEIMWSTYIDPYDIFARIGPELHFISYAKLQEEIAGVSDAAAKAYLAELSQIYTVEPDVDQRLFLESVRASLALSAIRDKFNLDALALNDVSPELFQTIGLRPGFYPESFHKHNAVLVPEGDLGAGIMVYMLRQLTGKHVNYVEPFYMEKATGTFAGGHAGPHDYTDERYRHLVKISRDVRFAKTSYKYAGAPFAWCRISPGLKTFAHFSEENGHFKIVCFTAESLPGEHALCSYCHSDFKPETPGTELFEKIIKTGTTQHFAVVEGDLRAELAVLARINNFEFYQY
jgi:L-arabinose isomerase